MKIFFALLTIALVSIFFIACGKDENPTPQPTKTEQLTGSSWRLDTAGLDQDRNGTIDFSVMNLIGGCIRDNNLSFQAGNTGTTNEGPTKCNTTDPQTTNFNWNFSDAEANLNISNSILTPLNGKSKILELSSTILKLTRDTVISGFPAAIVVQLKH